MAARLPLIQPSPYPAQNALDLLGAAADAPIVVKLRHAPPPRTFQAAARASNARGTPRSRIGECHAREGNFAAQLSVLTEIPAHARPAEVHMALGRLLQRMGCDLDAIASYKAAMAPPRPHPHRAGLRRAS